MSSIVKATAPRAQRFVAGGTSSGLAQQAWCGDTSNSTPAELSQSQEKRCAKFMIAIEDDRQGAQSLFLRPAQRRHPGQTNGHIGLYFRFAVLSLVKS
ncbi:hypothetical protein E2C01_021073 [Portunus trituberculatus]|uniref:Uncharacterized protein n=1 Tax=Portunus trituberculatus TaxID=210409 RepID=A0A5B7E3P3_PORTR|nr:hypothetical protein [Portunus trituberculatus]